MTTSPCAPRPAAEPPRLLVLHIVQTPNRALTPELMFTSPLSPIRLHINNADGTYAIAHLAGEELTYLDRSAAACGCP
ncbi:hypothetical protein AB0F17_61865 [Nonomuraea sp. NPDC026600]|uniref:hypothetical protein n=1 Tax=Nonomuraea sp. NPDC026600 TaxID=3155363 RepID=UPI0033FFA7F2